MIISLIKGGFFNQLKIILKKKVNINQVDLKYKKITYKLLLKKILRIVKILCLKKIHKKNFIFLIKNILKMKSINNI